MSTSTAARAIALYRSMLRDILSAGIGRRLAVRRLQPAARYIADADKPEGVGDLRCLLVEEVLSAVGDLGVDCLGATLLAGALGASPRASKCVFVLSQHTGILDLGARRKRHALFEAEVNADLGILPVRLRLVLDHEVAIPAPPRILRKRPGLDAPFDFPVLPEPHLVPVEHDDRSGEPDRLVLEGHPPEAALSSPAELGLPRPSATIDVLVTHFLDRLRRDTDQRSSPAGGCLKFCFSGPTLVMLESMTLGAVAVISYEVDRARGRVELLAGRLVGIERS